MHLVFVYEFDWILFRSAAQLLLVRRYSYIKDGAGGGLPSLAEEDMETSNHPLLVSAGHHDNVLSLSTIFAVTTYYIHDHAGDGVGPF